MLSRKDQPTIKTEKSINFIKAKKNFLKNSVPVYTINAGKQDLVKLEFIFSAGCVNNEIPLVAEITNSMLDEGTETLPSSKIADEIDYYGAYLKLETGRHYASVILYTINKYFEQTLSVVKDIILNPIFPEKELNIILQHKLQEFKINKVKTERLAFEKFFEEIYGENNPYGRADKKSDFKNINTSIIKEFHKNNYTLDSLKIILCGKIHDKHIELLQRNFGDLPQSPMRIIKEFDNDFPEIKKGKYFVEKPGAVQASIKVGKRVINKLHPDYIKLSVSNVVLGGYFGSRLMANIREDKGYTYGIYSTIGSLLNSGYFVIGAETGKDVYEKTLEEIYKEIKILRTKLVPEKELNRVRNYLIGKFIKNFDGALSLSEAFKSILNSNLDYSYYEKYFENIKTITPETIREVFDEYLHEDSMITIVSSSK